MEGSLTIEQQDELLNVLKKRFNDNIHRHQTMTWETVVEKLNHHPEKLRILYNMEQSGGEPDIVEIFQSDENIYFVDCAKESPQGRRRTCYDDEALKARKKYKPEDSACNMAEQIGVELLTEEQYRTLQTIEPFDLKTSSWIKTPESIRQRGGALFCDRRYDHVFVYHNGAESYYSSRGFRGMLIL